MSERIKNALSGHHSTVYVLEKYAGGGCVPFASLRELTGRIFHTYDALVFVCACGIAVRMIAPYVISKQSDPAVVAVDEQGHFAVSLLSGHLGGANALTGAIARVIGAMPVITTATDAGGRFSPDLFAKANGLHICEPDAAKAVAAAVVDGKPIGLRSDYPTIHLPPEIDLQGDCEAGISISSDTQVSPFRTTLHLVPQNIIIGVGCKRNLSPDVLERFLLDTLREHHIALCRVAALHTIDVKKDEPALTAFCRQYRIPLRTFTAEELTNAKGSFTPSEFVMKTVGVDNVCERSAALGGRLIIRKQTGNGVTFAAAEREVRIDFGRVIENA